MFSLWDAVAATPWLGVDAQARVWLFAKADLYDVEGSLDAGWDDQAGDRQMPFLLLARPLKRPTVQTQVCGLIAGHDGLYVLRRRAATCVADTRPQEEGAIRDLEPPAVPRSRGPAVPPSRPLAVLARAGSR